MQNRKGGGTYACMCVRVSPERVCVGVVCKCSYVWTRVSVCVRVCVCGVQVCVRIYACVCAGVVCLGVFVCVYVYGCVF